MIQSAYISNSHTPFVRTSCTTAGSAKVKSSRVSSSSSTNLRILAARNRSSKSLLNGGKVSAVVELAADLLETKERQQHTIRKRTNLRVNPPPPEATQTVRFSPVELQKFARRLEEVYRNSPTVSPKEDLGQDWRKYQGSNNWEGLLNPLSPKTQARDCKIRGIRTGDLRRLRLRRALQILRLLQVQPAKAVGETAPAKHGLPGQQVSLRHV
ncbi:hypothetical protein SUGI_0379600 [Cryptomeria japonica]|nr:hypothetical protein SUGI_0379600 [Cryptomeria japonica]